MRFPIIQPLPNNKPLNRTVCGGVNPDNPFGHTTYAERRAQTHVGEIEEIDENESNEYENQTVRRHSPIPAPGTNYDVYMAQQQQQQQQQQPFETVPLSPRVKLQQRLMAEIEEEIEEMEKREQQKKQWEQMEQQREQHRGRQMGQHRGHYPHHLHHPYHHHHPQYHLMSPSSRNHPHHW